MLTTRELKQGEILILADDNGRWAGAFTFVGVDEQNPDRLLVRERGGEGRLYRVLTSRLRRPIRPAVVPSEPAPPAGEGPAAGDSPPASGASPAAARADRPGKITAAQRRRLFARAHELGCDVDDLRAMTPTGSVSKLTRPEAAWLIDQLEGSNRGGPPADSGPTARQLAMIGHLRDEIGFAGPQFDAWLAGRFKVHDLPEITDRRLASRVIGGLLAMKEKRTTVPWHGPTRDRVQAGGDG